ncbi:hypothetical protein VSS74_09510 [Conexibacter stalactiti]|uniref:Uncharacterized protein n=1 Tax=Conexibacter stalactiti TaxID=1940611 RepID=A0ABU4HMP8_9ACTN|nr:hypothetical protein [Conexibacter stalactiti]MDW5594573.1 hypothetical protein [Conexibacter stalactiti]MEC5035215.1 hypothetical protein [Conexibacter stalactiti]
MTTGSTLRALAAGVAALAVALPLAACGSSDDGSGSTTSTVAAAAGQGGRDRGELAVCLREHGVELPQPPAGAGRPDGAPQGEGTPPDGATTPEGAPPGDGSGPPAGGPGGGFFGRDLSDAERERLEAAFEACGGSFGGERGGPGMPGRAGAAGGRGGAPSAAALEQFVACVRRNGYDLPDANTSGDGPVFDDDAVDRDDPAFVSASRTCQRYLAPTS